MTRDQQDKIYIIKKVIVQILRDAKGEGISLARLPKLI